MILRRSSVPLAAIALGAAACHGKDDSRDRASSVVSPVPVASNVSSVKAGREAAASSAPLPPASSASFYAQSFSRKASVATMTELGRRLFFDPELSASHKMSCATCHDPRHAYGPPDARSTQLGGPDMRSPGLR